MPVKARAAKQRRPVFAFASETVDLFRQLEATPLSLRRGNLDFRRSERRLHDLLDLAGPFICSVCSVLDACEEPLWLAYRPDQAVAEWRLVHDVRLALLEAAAVHARRPDQRGA
jgi:hypothetical protein